MRTTRAAAVTAALALLATACSGCLLGAPASITATALFPSVGNLVAGAPVQMAGISVGSVQSISLDGTRAKVVMSIERSARVPADVSAKAEQSTVLGEEVVELAEPSATSSAAAATGSAPGAAAPGRLLSNGSVITSASLVPGIQQFVSGGTAVLGSIGTSQLAALINAGGEGFGGQATTLRHLISDLDTVTGAYAAHSAQIRQLVASMHELSGSLAPHASSDAEALGNLSRTVTILDDQSGRLVNLVKELDALSLQGRSLLGTEMRQIDLQLSSLAGVSSTLDGQQSAIAELLEELPGHNMTLHDVTVNRFAQVVDALIVCGLPDGGSTNQAASSCHGAGDLP